MNDNEKIALTIIIIALVSFVLIHLISYLNLHLITTDYPSAKITVVDEQLKKILLKQEHDRLGRELVNIAKGVTGELLWFQTWWFSEWYVEGDKPLLFYGNYLADARTCIRVSVTFYDERIVVGILLHSPSERPMAEKIAKAFSVYYDKPVILKIDGCVE